MNKEIKYFFPPLFFVILVWALNSCERNRSDAFYQKKDKKIKEGPVDSKKTSQDREYDVTEISNKRKVCHSVEDVFRAKGEKRGGNKVDILWVVDGSGSMVNDQIILIEHFSSFIEKFIKKKIDFQLAVAGPDPYKELEENKRGEKGRYSRESFQKLSSSYALNNETAFKEYFNGLVRNIKSGSDESGLAASRMFLETHGERWLRKDAFLVIIYVTDEPDSSGVYKNLLADFEGDEKIIKPLKNYFKKQTHHNPSDYAHFFKNLKSNDFMVKVYSIVDTDPQSQFYGPRYIQVAQKTNGHSHHLHKNFDNILGTYSDQIVEFVKSGFVLSSLPQNPTQMEVKLNGVASTHWTYGEGKINFTQGHLKKGDKIEVSYIQCIFP